MKKILGGRQSGKTRRLIKHAARNNGVIVCMTKHQADFIYRMASQMSVLIPKPISLEELRFGKQVGKHNEFMLDEADTILESLLHIKFIAATFRDNDVERVFRKANPAIRDIDNIIARCSIHKDDSNEQQEGW